MRRLLRAPWPTVAGRGCPVKLRCCTARGMATAGERKSRWGEHAHRRAFMEEFARKRGIRKPEDWKAVQRQEVEKAGGKGLTRRFGSFHELLEDAFPELQLTEDQTRSTVSSSFWNSMENCRSFMDGLARRWGITEPSDWKRVTWNDVCKEGGAGLLKPYKSLAAALQAIYPERDMSPAVTRSTKPSGYWEERAHRRQYLEEFAKVHGIDGDWSNVQVQQVTSTCGAGGLAYYGHSLRQALQDLFPEIPPECLPPGRTTGEMTPERRREFFERVREEYGVLQVEDWSKVSARELRKSGEGKAVLKGFGTLTEALRATYEGEEFPDRLCLSTLPEGYWKAEKNRRELLECIARKNGVEKASDWKKVSTAAVRKERGGASALQKFGNSLYALVRSVYPEVSREDVDKRKQAGHWGNPQNRRRFLDAVAERFGVKEPEDWAKVTSTDISEMQGGSLLNSYPSVFSLLRDTYPEHGERWSVFTCRPMVPSSYWAEPENIRAFMLDVKRLLKVSAKEDWYRVSRDQLMRLGGGTLAKTHRLVDLLRIAFPEEEWDEVACSNTNKKAVQRFVGLQLGQLLPSGQLVIEEYAHASLSALERNDSGTTPSRAGLVFDIFVPELDLAVEYHGEHHYKELSVYGPLEPIRTRDAEKRALCQRHGIRLVEVPFWWDHSTASLAATVEATYPGLLRATWTTSPKARDDDHRAQAMQLIDEVEKGLHKAVSLTPPEGTVKEQDSTADASSSVRQRVRYSGVWDWEDDSQGFLVCRHFDGIRVRWSSSEGKLATAATGRVLPAPAEWLQRLPRSLDLDGFIVLRGAEAGSTGALLRLCFPVESVQPMSDNLGKWESTSLLVTDSSSLSSLCLTERLDTLKELLRDTEELSVVPHVTCEGNDHLRQMLDEAIDAGSRGLLLRKPDSRYKFREDHRDAIRVKKVLPGAVRMVRKAESSRAVIAECPSGLEQVVRCPGDMYRSPPPTGAVLQVGHFGQWGLSGRYKWPFVTAVLPASEWNNERQAQLRP